MSKVNPLHTLFLKVAKSLGPDELETLKKLLEGNQIEKSETEKIKTALALFVKLKEKGCMSETNLTFLKELLEHLDRRDLIALVETFEADQRDGDRQQHGHGKGSAASEHRIHSPHTQSTTEITASRYPDIRSVYCDVTASSERNLAAVEREILRAMQDPYGETTSVQHHIDNHNLRRAQYEHILQQAWRVLDQRVQEQVTDSMGSPPSTRGEYSTKTKYPTEIPEPKYPDIVLECEKRLKSYYSNLSHILPLPWWDGTNRLKLENVYTELELETKKGNKRDFARQEIFSPKHDRDSHANPKRVLIEGDPGYGKSTFCKKLAYDWAEGKQEYLNCFKLLFYFEVKDLLQCDGKNIQDAIFDQLSWDVREEGKRQELWNYIQNNQMKVCFVFDGLDEVTTKDLPTYFNRMVQVKKRLLSDCPVIVTSRKIRDKNSKQMYDTHLLIKGFDGDKAMDFVEKHINAMNSTGELQTEAKASDFLKDLKMSGHKNIFFDFMQSPLNTLMLCNIWVYAKKLPHTITKLYEEIIHSVVKRYRESHDCDSHFDEEIEQALSLMGKMSYHSLTTHGYKFYFSEDDISKNRYLRELGLLTKISGIPSKYGFYHLTFQEYFASMYVAELLEIDRSKFVDAVEILTKQNYLKYEDTVLAFMGGKLRSNVGEIFKVWEEQCFCPHVSFDPRPILYESCCKSTDVFKHCAQFLPEELRIDFNTMVRESDSNQLDVNATVLQCADIRSESFSFVLPAFNADALAMYQKCHEALQKNWKTFKDIDVVITNELNENNRRGKDYIEDFKIISKTPCDCRPDLKPVTVHNLRLQIPKFIKSSVVCIYRYITHIVKGFAWVSADNIHIEKIPFGNLKSMEDVLVCLSGNKQLKVVSVTFCEESLKFRQNNEIEITAKVGKFDIRYLLNTMDFTLVDLHSSLSKFACVNKERVFQDFKENFDREETAKFITENIVSCMFYKLHNLDSHQSFDTIANDSVSLDVKIKSDFNGKINDDEIDIFHKLEMVNIRLISLSIIVPPGFNIKHMYWRAPAIAKALSGVSADKLEIKGLPLENIELMQELLNCFSINGLLKAVRVESHYECVNDSKAEQLFIEAKVGKFTTYSKMDIKYVVDYKLADFLSLLTSFASVHNERVSLDVQINCQVQEKLTPNITDILHRLESVDMRLLSFFISCSSCLKIEEISLYISNILEILRVSADNLEFNVHEVPLLHLELVRDVIVGLNSQKLLKSVYLNFFEDSGKYSKAYTVKVCANFGKFQIHYLVDSTDAIGFELVDLHSLLSTFASVDNERVSLDVAIKCDFQEKRKSNIIDTLQSLQKVNIERLLLNITGFSHQNKEEISLYISTILKALSRGSVDILKFIVEEIPLLHLELVREVVSGLNSQKLIKSVHFRIFEDCSRSSKPYKVTVYAELGKIHIHCYMDTTHFMDFELADMQNLLSTFASVDDERVSVDVEIDCDMKEKLKSHVTDTLQRLESVDIRNLSFLFTGSTYLQKDEFSSYISTIIKALSQISADMVGFLCEKIPILNLELMRQVAGGLKRYTLLKSILMTFFRGPLYYIKAWKVKLSAKFGKFEIVNCMNTTNFLDLELEDLHSMHSLFLSADNERGSLDVMINCDVKEKRNLNITDTLHKLQSVDIKILSLNITGFRHSNKKEIYLFFSTIAEALSQVSADKVEFIAERIPLLNVEVVRRLVGCLNSYKLLKSVGMTFISDYIDIMIEYNVKVCANFGKFHIIHLMKTTDFMDFELVDLNSLISSFASIDNESVSLEVQTKCDVKEKQKPNIIDTLHKLQTVDIGLLSLNITGFSHSNKEEILYISTIMKMLSQVSADKVQCVVKQIRLLRLELMREVVSGLNSQKLLKSIKLMFFENRAESLEAYKLIVCANFENCQIYYYMDTTDFMDFELVNLHSLLSTFASVKKERVSLDVEIQRDVKEKLISNITDTLHKLQSVDIGRLALNITDLSDSNIEEISIHIPTIIHALSQVSADKVEFHSDHMPLQNLEFIRVAVGGLQSNKPLKSVKFQFCDDCVDISRAYKVKMNVNFGKIRIRYLTNTTDFMDFELADLLSMLSTFASASVNNDRLSVDVEIDCDMKKKLKSQITDTLHRLESVDIRDLSFFITGSTCLNKEEISLYISTIIKASSQVSADRVGLITEQIPLLNLELVRQVAGGLNSYTLLKFVHILFFRGSLDSIKAWKVKLLAKFGKFEIAYIMNTTTFMDLDLTDVHSVLSIFSFIYNKRESLDVIINCDVKEKRNPNITDILHKLQSVDIRLLSLNITGFSHSNKKEICLYISTIIEALSFVSADKVKFVAEQIPLLNLEYVRRSVGCLNSYKLLKSVEMKLCVNCVDNMQRYDVKVCSNFGKFHISHLMNTSDFMDFELVDMRTFISTFASVDNERASLDVQINWDVTNKLNSKINDTLHKLRTVDVGLLSLNIIGLSNPNMEEISLYASPIIKALVRVSADQVEFAFEGISVAGFDMRLFKGL